MHYLAHDYMREEGYLPDHRQTMENKCSIKLYLRIGSTNNHQCRHLQTGDFTKESIRMQTVSRTASTAVYSMIEMESNESAIHRNILALLANIARNPGTTKHRILERQIGMSTLSDDTFLSRTRRILHKYFLPD